MILTAAENISGVLSVRDTERPKAVANLPHGSMCSKENRENEQLAKSVAAYLNANLDSHITIAQLASLFHVSQTQLKTSFKETFGESVYGYTRAQKMRAAAKMLQETQYTVLEVAGQFGYSNGSKFAKAFRDVMGVTPKEYRNQHKLPGQLE